MSGGGRASSLLRPAMLNDSLLGRLIKKVDFGIPARHIYFDRRGNFSRRVREPRRSIGKLRPVPRRSSRTNAQSASLLLQAIANVAANSSHVTTPRPVVRR